MESLRQHNQLVLTTHLTHNKWHLKFFQLQAFLNGYGTAHSYEIRDEPYDQSPVQFLPCQLSQQFYGEHRLRNSQQLNSLSIGHSSRNDLTRGYVLPLQ